MKSHRMFSLPATVRMLVVLVMLVCGCEGDKPFTQIRVIVDSDLDVGTELTRLKVRVFDRSGETELRSQEFALAKESDGTRFTLPMSFKLAPDTQQSTIDFRLVVTGIGPLGPGGSDTEVVEQQALASFRPGEALRLDVFLGRSCLLQLCQDEQEGGLSPLTCDVDTGRCVDVPERDQLPEAVGDGVAQYEEERARTDDASAAGDLRDAADGADATTEAMDAGKMDAGEMSVDGSDVVGHQPEPNPQGSLDGEIDAAARPLLDAAVIEPDSMPTLQDGGDASGGSGDSAAAFDGVATVGSPCSSEGTKACAGNNSTDALVCENGAWRPRTVCDGNNRCDTAVGGTRGTCQPIAAQCIGKNPGDTVCVAAERFRCGRDLVDVAAASCTATSQCHEGMCVCRTGFVPNESSTACVRRDNPQIVAIGRLGCALLESHRVFCWGANRLPYAQPVTHPSGDGALYAKDLSLAYQTACAVTDAGQVACWGLGAYNLGGELLTPVYVETAVGTPLKDVQQVAAGGNHGCAVTSSGAVYCWGLNNFRQLGTGSANDREKFASRVLGVGGTGFLGNVRQVVVGAHHSCARTSDLNVICWGANTSGQIGVPTPGSPSAPPTLVPGTFSATDLAASPASHTTCAVKSGGTVSCWGRNAEGQLGIGIVSNVEGPGQVLNGPGAPLSAVLEVSVGYRAACARSSNAVSCWGLNDRGQLGAPFDTSALYFATVVSTVRSPTALAQASDDTNCYVDTEGRLLCWGAGTEYQLGNGEQQDYYIPEEVRPTWGAAP